MTQKIVIFNGIKWTIDPEKTPKFSPKRKRSKLKASQLCQHIFNILKRIKLTRLRNFNKLYEIELAEYLKKLNKTTKSIISTLFKYANLDSLKVYYKSIKPKLPKSSNPNFQLNFEVKWQSCLIKRLMIKLTNLEKNSNKIVDKLEILEKIEEPVLVNITDSETSMSTACYPTDVIAEKIEEIAIPEYEKSPKISKNLIDLEKPYENQKISRKFQEIDPKWYQDKYYNKYKRLYPLTRAEISAGNSDDTKQFMRFIEDEKRLERIKRNKNKRKRRKK